MWGARCLLPDVGAAIWRRQRLLFPMAKIERVSGRFRKPFTHLGPDKRRGGLSIRAFGMAWRRCWRATCPLDRSRLAKLGTGR
jgi:hypothetical protein